MLQRKKITFDSFIRGVLTALVLIGLLMLVNKLSGVLLPFFLAWFLAYLIYPLVTFFQYKVRLRSRVLSIFAAMLTVLVVFALATWAFVPPMVHELIRLKAVIEAYILQNENGAAIPEAIQEFSLRYLDAEWLQSLLNAENIMEGMRIVMPKLGAIISTSFDVIAWVFTAFVSLLYFFFILLDYERIGNNWINLLPVKYRPFALKLTTDVSVGMSKYFRGQALIAFCVGVLFSIGFLIIDFPLAIGLGLFIGLLNMVPYLQIIGYIPAILLALLKSAETGQSFWVVLGLATLVFAVVQLIQDAYLTPRIMGHVTGLNPAIILLSLSVWGALMGIVGMIIALPATTLLLSYYRHYIRRQDVYNRYMQRKQSTEDIRG